MNLKEWKETSDKNRVFTPKERTMFRQMLELHNDAHTIGYVMGRIARVVCEKQGYQIGYVICFAEFTGRDKVVEEIASLYERMAKQTPVQKDILKDCVIVNVKMKDQRTYSMLITADKKAYYTACELLFFFVFSLSQESRACIFVNVIDLKEKK